MCDEKMGEVSLGLERILGLGCMRSWVSGVIFFNKDRTWPFQFGVVSAFSGTPFCPGMLNQPLESDVCGKKTKQNKTGSE